MINCDIVNSMLLTKVIISMTWMSKARTGLFEPQLQESSPFGLSFLNTTGSQRVVPPKNAIIPSPQKQTTILMEPPKNPYMVQEVIFNATYFRARPKNSLLHNKD